MRAGRPRSQQADAGQLALVRPQAKLVDEPLNLAVVSPFYHEAELEQARRLMALAPRDRLSLMYLRHAAECNGLDALALAADGQAALRGAPDGGLSIVSEKSATTRHSSLATRP